MEEINQILKQNSFKFKHNFGQNFITDINLLNAIVKDANVLRTDNVLEIGTGAGTLTKQLSEATDKKVITVEIDKTLEPVLKQNLSECKNVEIKFGDILKFKPSELRQWFNNEPFKVVANLPYYISSPIIFYLLENNFNIQSLTIMLQYELATRLVAKPNSAQYGAVTVLLDLISNVKLIRKVPRTVFTPQPKVDSAVVRIDVDKNKWQVDDKCINFIKNSFVMKRKTLQNNLSKSYGVEKDKIVQVLALSEIEPLARAENLSTEQFVKLYNNFSKLLKIN